MNNCHNHTIEPQQTTKKSNIMLRLKLLFKASHLSGVLVSLFKTEGIAH